MPVPAAIDRTTPSDELRWEAVLGRDAARDSDFVYGVSTTRIYCRPSCPSRRPAREHVSFYSTPEAAEAAGYRPCRRCEPRSEERAAVRQVRRARQYLDQHAGHPVTLEQLARMVGLSAFHLQRLFKRMVGVTPKAYAAGWRMDLMKSRLRRGDTVSRATYEAGYGSGSRAYQDARARLGMTPGVYRNGGRGTRIRYTVVPTTVGFLLAAATERGICAVTLGDDPGQLEGALRQEYPAATVDRDDESLQGLVEAVARDTIARGQLDTLLDVRGSRFQWQVWEALRRIPVGETRSYQAIAKELGRPKAARAVARACASNRVALIIPCHRAVREDGSLGGYRWGVERKRTLLEQESRAGDGSRAASVPVS